jgi:hypothetical protein
VRFSYLHAVIPITPVGKERGTTRKGGVVSLCECTRQGRTLQSEASGPGLIARGFSAKEGNQGVLVG